jgi:hypothetical protein
MTCDAVDGVFTCDLEEDHDGAHNDPDYGDWFSTERALLADARITRANLYDGDDFPCCSGGKHEWSEAAIKIVADVARRQALKRSRMARRTVTGSILKLID